MTGILITINVLSVEDVQYFVLLVLILLKVASCCRCPGARHRTPGRCLTLPPTPFVTRDICMPWRPWHWGRSGGIALLLVVPVIRAHPLPVVVVVVLLLDVLSTLLDTGLLILVNVPIPLLGSRYLYMRLLSLSRMPPLLSSVPILACLLLLL